MTVSKAAIPMAIQQIEHLIGTRKGGRVGEKSKNQVFLDRMHSVYLTLLRNSAHVRGGACMCARDYIL